MGNVHIFNRMRSRINGNVAGPTRNPKGHAPRRQTDDVVEAIVARTERASAAFIKELLRRAAQFHLEAGGGDGTSLTLARLETALEEMLFAGGSLNVKLLGGAANGSGE